MSDNAFTRILNQLDQADSGITEKTASVSTAESAEDRMLEAVRSVSAKTATENYPNTPTGELERMANQAHEAEQELIFKQAHTMGAVLADGFMERFAQYDTALADQGIKTASTVDTSLLKEAASVGYVQAVEDMEKQAAEEYEQGFNDQLQYVYKLAAETHYTGQAIAEELVNASRR